jgi:acetylglutamate kinase
MMKKMGKKPTFVHGHRVTDKETMDIVEMVLGGLINKEIVSLINSHGGKAVGLSGKDGGLINAKKKIFGKSRKKGSDETIDIGLVGEVSKVDPHILISLEKDSCIPVISPIGVGTKGETFNINADHVAAYIAGALKAEKLIILTDVSGIMDKENKIISTLTKKEITKLIKKKIITEGMLPKVQACLEALDQGVSKTHIIDGRIPHCLLLEIFTKEGIGTEIRK